MSGNKAMVKNRAPAPVQITAEQILREAQERQGTTKPTRHRITDAEELDDYRMSKRKAFEDEIRRQRHHMGTWLKYAQWEESQHEFKRARSVYERAVEVDYKSSTLWLKYAEMEQQHKFINHARNVWDRAVTLLPRVDQFWYKYAYMEEMVGSLDNARQVFERWMQWEPSDKAWYSYIQLEMRAREPTRARAIYDRYVKCHPSEKAYIKYAKWEERQQQLALSRSVFERAMEELRDDERTQVLYMAYAQFEERCREYDRCRAIYQFALDHTEVENSSELHKAFTRFEKQYGDKKSIDDVVITRRRAQYEQQIQEDPKQYDIWFDYIRLEEDEGSPEQVRELYERAISQVPPIAEKQYWRRYIYLWIQYAMFEELIADDTKNTREVYKTCLNLIPHDQFTFAKIWVMYAKFEIRQRDLNAARKILGTAIGKCPTEKLFKSYIGLEIQLGEVDRCRQLYQKYLLYVPHSCITWKSFADLEKTVGEMDRSREVYELAIQQSVLDKPEFLWKAYIDLEIDQNELENARKLYERLLERTKHVKVWCSFAQFEWNHCKKMENAREIYERSHQYFKEENLNVERAMILENWLEFEKSIETDNEKQIEKIKSKIPRRVMKKRMAYADDGTELGMEDYEDFLFPEDENSKSSLKLFAAAHSWKKRLHEETA